MDYDDQRRLELALREWNLWWAGEPYDPGVPRDALVEVRRWLGHTEVLAICGIRRCGKSTIM